MMTLTARTAGLLVLVVACLAALVPARTAQAAANPELIAQRQIALINTLTDRTHTQMVRICEGTVATVNRLDARNVANARISVTGDRGVLQIDRLSDKIWLSISRSSSKIIATLTRLNADQALIDQVSGAMNEAMIELSASEDMTKAPIVAAVAAATSN